MRRGPFLAAATLLFLTFLILVATRAHSATITSNATGGGNWATGSTWVGGVAPGSGDSAVCASGDTLTIPVSTSVTVGTSPADDTGTAAIATATTSSTCNLVINGTLVYRGPVRLASATTIGPGATLTHDSSLAATPSAAHYSWQQAQISGRTTSVLNLNGTSGSRITISNAASSGYSGGFITPGSTGTADGGQLLGAYFDVTGGCGQAGSSSTLCMSAYLNSSGDTFSIDHATFSGNNGHFAFAQMHGAAVWSITNIAYQTATPLANTTASTKCFEFGIGSSNFLTNAKTTGTRLVSGNFFDGCVVTLQGATNGFDTLHQGIVFANNWLSNVSTTIGPLTYIGGAPNFDSGNWHDNLIWSTGLSTVHAAWNSPAGTLQRTYSLSDSYTGASVSGSPTCNSFGNVNYHVNQMQNDMVYDQWIFEPYAKGSSKIQTGGGLGNGTTNFAITMQNTIELPSACGDGAGFGSSYLIVDSLACTQSGSSWCPLITFKNNTVLASDDQGGAACGNGSERSDYTSGVAVSQGNYNNIYWNAASAHGCFERYTGTVPANTFVGTQGYNWKFNVSAGGTGYTNTTPAYASAPGTGDASGDPLFTDSTRNFLKWCQTINGADTSWLDCKAHFADTGTASHNAAYSISALIDYVRAGFAPTNQSLATAGSAGDRVGAVDVVAASSTSGGRRRLFR